MTKLEFLETLRGKLGEELPTAKVTENVQYYKQYITDQVGAGQAESAVIEMLGDPLLIARTIISTQGSGQGEGSGFGSTGQEGNTERQEKKTQAFGQFNMKSWKLWLVLGALVLFFLFIFLIRILGFFLPVILPVVLILLVVSFIAKRR